MRFSSPFCLTFLHMVDSSPGRWSLGFSCLQSVMGKDRLSNGSAHLGSPSERHTQHLMAEVPTGVRIQKREMTYFYLKNL